MWEIVALVTLGIAVGSPVTLACTRWLRSFLFGLKPDDAFTILAAGALMLGVALFSGYWPARRASQVDPMVALRYE
jgi:ABC-type antimicrobial peptide transport system permease subunit